MAVIPAALARGLRRGEISLRMLERSLAAAPRERGYVLRTDQEAPPLALRRGARATPVCFEIPLLAV